MLRQNKRRGFLTSTLQVFFVLALPVMEGFHADAAPGHSLFFLSEGKVMRADFVDGIARATQLSDDKVKYPCFDWSEGVCSLVLGAAEPASGTTVIGQRFAVAAFTRSNICTFGLVDRTPGKSNPRWAPNGVREVACSPKGSAVAVLPFASLSDASGLWIIDVHNGQILAQTVSEPFKSRLAWSPDGGEVAFYSTPLEASADYPHPFYDTEKIPDIKGYAVCVLHVETGKVRVVGPPGYGITEPRYFPPSWSPDGKRIAFEATYERMWGPGSKERWADPERRVYPCVHVVNRDGTGLKKLSAKACRDSCPAWSPDGSKIAFVSQRAKRQDNGIYIMNADGTDKQKVPGTSGSVERILWSPDGKWIAFTSTQLAQGKSKMYPSLFVVDPAGTRIIPVCPQTPASDFRWATLP